MMDDIKDVQFTDMQESKYVKPFRVRYKQDGKQKVWDCVRSHDSVAILIFNTTRKVFVFVEQFRPAVYVSRMCREKKFSANAGDSWKGGEGKLGQTLELCAGIIDKDMSPEDTAVAEIFEECGYKTTSEKLERIASYPGSVGTAGSQQTLFFVEVTDAMKVADGGGLETEGEQIRVIEMSIDQAKKYISSAYINSPPGFMYALFWFLAGKSEQF